MKFFSKHPKLKIFIITLFFLVIFLIGGFLVWASIYYHADKKAEILLKDENVIIQKNLVILPSSSKTGLIFYPGAKVESISYLPILDKIRQKCSINCILVHMPLNLAVFDQNAADDIYSQFPNIDNWYIGGHSLGGAIASNYASKNTNKIKGVILMGSYIYGSYPPSKTLTIYGTLNNLQKNINYTDNIVKIEGGNHAQFGNYGKQSGDEDATISTQEQQNQTVNAIYDFLNKQ